MDRIQTDHDAVSDLPSMSHGRARERRAGQVWGGIMSKHFAGGARRAVSFTALMLGSAAMLPGVAWAQNADPETQAAQANDAPAAQVPDDGNDIVVTAQRRAERLQDVPI